jgi:hypothetical protein
MTIPAEVKAKPTAEERRHAQSLWLFAGLACGCGALDSVLPGFLAWAFTWAVMITAAVLYGRWSRNRLVWLPFACLIADFAFTAVQMAVTWTAPDPMSGSLTGLGTGIILVLGAVWMIKLPLKRETPDGTVHVFHHVIHHGGAQVPGTVTVTAMSPVRKAVTGGMKAIEPSRVIRTTRQRLAARVRRQA